MTFIQIIGKCAARGLRPADIRAFLDGGGDVNCLDQRSGWTLLHFAAEDANPEVIRLLVASGAQLDLPDLGGQTPLHLAVDSDLDTSSRNGRRATAMPTTQTLIELGADETRRAADGATPCDFAAAYGQEALYDALSRQRCG